MSAVNGIGWEMQWLSPRGWENVFHNLDGSPLIFPNREDAEEELDLYRTTTFCTDEYRIYEALSTKGER